MYRFLFVSFLCGTVCYSANEDLLKTAPDDAIRSREHAIKNSWLIAKQLLKEAKQELDTDQEEAIHKIYGFRRALKTLDLADPKVLALKLEVDRIHDVATAKYWDRAFKKEGSEALIQYRGECLKTHGKNPWVLVKHTTAVPKNLYECTGYVMKDGRCLATLEFLSIYDDFCMARLTPHWAASFYKTSGAGFKDDVKGAQVFAVDEKHAAGLFKLSSGRATVKAVLKTMKPEPLKAVQKLSFDGHTLAGKLFYLTDKPMDQLDTALKEAHAKFSDPLTLAVKWDVNPKAVEDMKKALQTKYQIKNILVKREGRVNKTAQKLKDIVLTRVKFVDTRITTVFEFIKIQSRNADPEGEGVNFILLPSGGKGEMDEPTVTMDAKDMTLEAFLKQACKDLGLKHRVENHAVLIGKDLPKEIKIPVAYNRKYGGMVLPKMSFVDVRLAVVFEFLQLWNLKLDPFGIGLPLSVTLPKADAEGAAKDNDFAGPKGNETPVTIDLDNTPFLEALQCVCYSSKLDMTFENGVIVIKPLVPAPAATK